MLKKSLNIINIKINSKNKISCTNKSVIFKFSAKPQNRMFPAISFTSTVPGMHKKIPQQQRSNNKNDKKKLICLYYMFVLLVEGLIIEIEGRRLQPHQVSNMIIFIDNWTASEITDSILNWKETDMKRRGNHRSPKQVFILYAYFELIGRSNDEKRIILGLQRMMTWRKRTSSMLTSEEEQFISGMKCLLRQKEHDGREEPKE